MEIARHGPVVVGWTDAGATLDRPARRSVGDDLLRALVGVLGGSGEARVERACAHCGSREHGVPRVAGEPIAASLAYAGPVVVGAAVRHEHAASVGIDVEPADRPVGDLTALFAPSDPPDLAGWTRIEAVLKATGRGIRVDPAAVAIGIDPGLLPGMLRTTAPPGFAVATFDGPEGYVVSLAVGDGPRRQPSEGPLRR